MSITVKFGFRHYELHNQRDLTEANSLWVKTVSQDDFENAMEHAGIDFSYDFLVADYLSNED